MGMGVLHTLVGFAFADQVLVDILQAGIFNSINGDFTREAAFWFFMFGFLLFSYGQLAYWLTKQGQILPASFGWGLLLVCVIGVVVMPASGFWLGVVPATAVLWQHSRSQTTVAV
jgi:hypothetical protein